MLTEQEVNEKYADFPLKFSSYYKYAFTFSGERYGVKITASTGGDSNGIYKFSVKADEERPFGEVDDWRSIHIYIGGEHVFDYYSSW
jgi:hypothetical protein